MEWLLHEKKEINFENLCRERIIEAVTQVNGKDVVIWGGNNWGEIAGGHKN